MIRRWLRAPALHFLLVGGLLFAVDSFRARRGEPARAPEVVITAARIAELRHGWRQQTGRDPNPAEERALVERAIDEEVLYRRALEIGLDRESRVVRERLIQNMQFLSQDSGKSEEALVREARALGLDRGDLVVRRHLTETMRLLSKLPESPEHPTDAELRELLERDADRYRIPGDVTLTHVYLSRDRRRGKLENDAARLLARLRSGGVEPAAAARLGDPFLLGHSLARQSPRELERIFGPGFAEAIESLAPGAWSGPVRSSYGFHLVRVEARTAPAMPALDSVRSQLLQRLLDERGAKRLAERLRELRARYAIRVEEAPIELVRRKGPGADEAVPLLPGASGFLGD